MSIAAKIAKNSIIMMTVEVVNKVLAFILTIIIARYLGDAGFGQYSFIITLMLLFQVLSEFGLDYLVIREISKDLDKTELFLRSVLVLKFVLGMISFILLSLLINLMHKSAVVVHGVYLAGAAIVFSSLANAFNSVFNAHEKLSFKAMLLILSKIVVFVLTLAALMLKQDVTAIIAVILISEMFRLFASWRIYVKNFAPLRIIVDFKTCKYLMGTSVSFALISIVSLIYFKIDIVMLSLMKGDRIVGWYSAAYGIFAAVLFIAEAYNQAVYPALSKYALNAKELLAFCWGKSVKFLLIISLPIAVVMTIFADRFITIFYSRDFIPSVGALQILIWTLPWIFVNSINMRVFYAADRQKEATALVVISMALNVVLNFLLIPRYSYFGASFATVFCEIINVSVFFWMADKILSLRLNVIRLFPKIVFVILLWGGIIFHLRFLNAFVLIVGGAGAYVMFLLFFKVFDGEDKILINKLIANLALTRVKK